MNGNIMDALREAFKELEPFVDDDKLFLKPEFDAGNVRNVLHDLTIDFEQIYPVDSDYILK